MDTFTTNDLWSLTGSRAAPCISIHMPTHPAGPERQQDSLRLKSLLQRAEEQLEEKWLRGASAHKILEPVRELAADPHFWEQRGAGLAIFVSPDTFARYRVPLRLDELSIVNARFQIKPLLALLNAQDRYWLLTLSQNKVALWEGNREGLRQTPVKGLPESKKQALNYENTQRASQIHSATNSAMGSGKQAAVFHGQGGAAETAKEEIEQYFRLVDAALKPVLRNAGDPLFLAGVDYVLPIYRKVNHYPQLVTHELVGNHDHWTSHQLHEKVWPLVQAHYDRSRHEAAARFRSLVGTGKASDDLRAIVPAAVQGKVETLFVDRRAHVWGVYDEQTGTAALHDETFPGADDLLDVAALNTLKCRGSVYAVLSGDLPGTTAAAAVFRY